MNDYQRVMNFLRDGTWQRAQTISLILGIAPREMRELAESTGAFIGGNQGYKRADLATPAELAEAAQGLESRVRKISRRAKKTRAWIAAPALMKTQKRGCRKATPKPPERQVSFW